MYAVADSIALQLTLLSAGPSSLVLLRQIERTTEMMTFPAGKRRKYVRVIYDLDEHAHQLLTNTREKVGTLLLSRALSIYHKNHCPRIAMRAKY